jgi:redox-sensitive bicupin YhaK (pirin superfamily)
LSSPDVQRRDGQKMLGLQSWIALPAGSEEIAPSFQHYAAEALPTVTFASAHRLDVNGVIRRRPFRCQDRLRVTTGLAARVNGLRR